VGGIPPDDRSHRASTHCSNHLLHFVDPSTGVNTNGIGNLWKCMKDKFKHMHGTCDAHISSYLAEYMWYREHCSRDACIENTVATMRWRYQLPQ